MLLVDGYQTTIGWTNGNLPVSPMFLEKEVQPIGIDGGGAIEIATMRNVQYRPKAPKFLVSSEDMTVQAAYDPAVRGIIFSFINLNLTWVITFPDGCRWVWNGWMGKFTPSNLKEGDFPLAEVKFHVSNMTTNGVESLVAFTAGPAVAGNWPRPSPIVFPPVPLIGIGPPS